MEVKLPVSELKSLLPALAKVLNRHSSLPVLQHIHLQRSADGVVQLQVTNLDAFAACRLATVQPGEPVAVLIPFERLAKTVKGCSPTDSLILLGDAQSLTLRHTLAGRPVDQPLIPLSLFEWPIEPKIEAPAVTLDESIKEGILRAFACCSGDSTRAAIMGAWLDASDPNAHYVMGTDGKHLFSANSFKLDLKEPVFIPYHAFLERPEVRNDGPWSLALQPGDKDDGWLQIRSNRWTFTVQRQDHSMPNWRLVVPESRTATVVFGEKATAFLLDVLPKLPGKDDPHQPIRLDLVDQSLLVTAGDESTPQGTTFPVEDAVVTGDNVTIAVDRTFALKALKWGLTELALIDGLSPLVFSAPGRRLVAMPVRTEGPAPVRVPDPVDPTPEPTAEPVAETPAPTQVEEPPEPQPVNRLAALPQTSPTPPPAPPAKPTIRSVIEQIDGIRDSLRSTIRQFGDVVDALRVVEKDRKTSDKEVELVRERLRALQSVSL
jgi:DNA polymerase III sliding clamp (beta) subunit (PCNA family)